MGTFGNTIFFWIKKGLWWWVSQWIYFLHTLYLMSRLCLHWKHFFPSQNKIVFQFAKGGYKQNQQGRAANGSYAASYDLWGSVWFFQAVSAHSAEPLWMLGDCLTCLHVTFECAITQNYWSSAHDWMINANAADITNDVTVMGITSQILQPWIVFVWKEHSQQARTLV